MAGQESSGAAPAMRASDADRERVVAVLQQALAEGRLTVGEFEERSATAYATRTQAELTVVLRDLVAGPGLPVAGSDAAQETAPPVVAVFSGARRAGRWRPARRETVVAVFGGVALDLREAQLPSRSMRLSAWAVFGGVDVTVPEGTHVELSGFSLFGGREVDADGPHPGPEAFVLHVHAVAVFGGVHVRIRGRRGRGD